MIEHLLQMSVKAHKKENLEGRVRIGVFQRQKLRTAMKYISHAIEEAKQILSAGFDYVTQKDGIMLFRRPKRFR